MSQSENSPLGHAVSKLHRLVVISCLLLATAIAGKSVAWALATYTDMRFETPAQPEAIPLVVSAEEPKQLHAADDPASRAAAEGQRLNEIGVLTTTDTLLHDVTNVSAAIGSISLLVLLSVLFFGTMLMASSGMPGVYKGVSAFVWSVIITALVFPLGELISLPWQSGVFPGYDAMIADITRARVDYGGDGATMSFYGRHLVLPIFCAAGAMMISVRFHGCVEAGLPEAQRYINPVIDREATEVAKRAGTLHGGRSAGALRDLLKDDEPRETVPAGSIREVSRGERPKRLI